MWQVKKALGMRIALFIMGIIAGLLIVATFPIWGHALLLGWPWDNL